MSNYNLRSIRESSMGKLYNVEFKMGNGEYQTFSGKLINTKGEYFGFEVDGYLAWLHRDRLIWMLPVYERESVKI